jgi:hypothetical protein
VAIELDRSVADGGRGAVEAGVSGLVEQGADVGRLRTQGIATKLRDTFNVVNPRVRQSGGYCVEEPTKPPL